MQTHLTSIRSPLSGARPGGETAAPAAGRTSASGPHHGAEGGRLRLFETDSFSRGPARGQPTGAARYQGLLTNEGHTTRMLEFNAEVLRARGEPAKADELLAIKQVYERAGAADDGRGDCNKARGTILAAMQARFGADGPQHWKLDSIGVGAQYGGTSYAHQAVAVIDRDTGKPTFVLDPTKMPMVPWKQFIGHAAQGDTNRWDQAYTLREFLQTRERNYGSGWQLGVP